MNSLTRFSARDLEFLQQPVRHLLGREIAHGQAGRDLQPLGIDVERLGHDLLDALLDQISQTW